MTSSSPSSSAPQSRDAAGPALYELWAGPFTRRDLEVVSFTGREAISKLFSFEVLALAAPDVALFDSPLLGSAAALFIQVPAGADGRASGAGAFARRVVRGVVASAQILGTSERRGRHLIRVRVAPKLWLLKRRVTSRVFQDLTVPEIVAKVLDAWSIPHAASLARTYAKRAYCVQHQESDYAFVARLLAEEGIFFTFQHPPSALQDVAEAGSAALETVVLGDSPDAYPVMAGDGLLHLREGEGFIPTDQDVTRFSLRRSARPGVALLRDYDFRRPLYDLRSEAAVGPPEDGGLDERALSIYEHRGEYDEAEVNPARAQVVLEQRRRLAHRAEGESLCRRLEPGHRFVLHAEATPHLDREYVVTRVDHRGLTPELAAPAFDRAGAARAPAPTYENRFECLPADAPARPKRPRRVLRQVLESAVVVGPAGEEIHTDEHGRVKVQFHWDLEGKRDEHSSCWVRVIQGWAGQVWGMQFVPRVGMEVMVTFLGGDQDCPVITGCVYNATHPPPFKLPEDRTRSGLRTHSSPGGKGHNELSFEDRAGAEQIYLHAQRDLDEEVGRDHRLSVTANQTLNIGGNRVDMVTGNVVEQVTGARDLLLVGDRTEGIAGTHREQIRKNRFVTVNGNATETVHGRYLTSVAKTYNLKVQGALSAEIGTGEEPSGVDVIAWGNLTVGTEKRAVLRAEQDFTLTCGESSIEITKDTITLKAPTIKLAASKVLTASGKGPSLRLDDQAELVSETVKIYSSKASLELGDDAELDGKSVKLNCKNPEPPLSEDESADPLTQPFSVKLTDAAFKPYANKDYVLHAAGNRYEGATDGDGKIELELPLEAQVANIALWLEARPTGPVKRYVVELREVPGHDTVAGAQMRLRNLGYYWGKETDEVDAPTRQALRDFQGDHDLQVTGELDEATKAKLSDLHGH
jgi:type VI secretion system secreted protein VgrG